MKNKIMALDLGSSGIKVTIFDDQSNILGSCYKEYNTWYPGLNMTLQSPSEWWEYFCTASKELLETAHIAPEEIACVAPSGQMSALIPIDASGKLLMDPCLIWADMRTTEQVKRIADEMGGQDKVYNLTGIGLTEETFTGYKIAWYKENMPDEFCQTSMYLQPKEFIGFKLTGNIATDFSDASETAMMDIENRTWSEKMLEHIGITKEVLPEIKKATDLLGHVTQEAAAASGLKEGTPVCVGGGDVSIAAAGAGIGAPGSAYLYIGSGSWVGVSSKEPLLDYQNKIACLCSLPGDSYVPHLVGFSGGLSHLWIRDIINGLDCFEEKISYDEIERLVEESGIGAHGLVFLPYLRGGGAPTQNINARGSFIGLEISHNYGDMCRSIMEGVAFILREMLEILDRINADKITDIKLIGGGAKSKIWRQIISDVIQKPVYCTRMKQEANTWGAAMCGGICVGLWKDFDEAQNLVTVESVNEPNPGAKEVYDQLYQTFLKSYDALTPIFDDLAESRVLIDQQSKED